MTTNTTLSQSALKNNIARMAFLWAYSDLEEDAYAKIGFKSWAEMYDESQKADFESFTEPQYRWEDDGEEVYIKPIKDDFQLSEQDALNYLFHYASSVLATVADVRLENY